MNNTQELHVLRRMTGKTIDEAYKALSRAENAYNERKEIYYQHIYNLGQIIEAKHILEEIENV